MDIHDNLNLEIKSTNYKLANLIKISPKIFVNNKKLDYSIYKQSDENNIFEKFLDFDTEYDKRSIESLETEDVGSLYVKHEDYDKYSKDINKYLLDALNEESSILIKSEIIYELASDTMHELLTGDITKTKIEHVSETIDASVKLALSEPNAIKSMIEVTTHDYYTYTHSVDVSTYALTFGAYLGLNEVQLKALTKGAMLHDLGKKNIPLEILNKNGKLTDDEFEFMKRHPSFGIDILTKLGENDDILFSIVEQHHEKVNGSGYPRGLKDDQIHPFAQIVAICDIFNALTTRRSYKEPMSSFEAIKIMYTHMREELNLKLLSKFINFMKQ